MSGSSSRVLTVVLLAVIVVLTLSTAYIHWWVGGMMLVLNSLGYLGLTVLVVGSAVIYPRALPLVLVALAGYAAVTIIGWLIMGPYFDVAYLAKGIEIVLITTIGVYEWTHRDDLRESMDWLRSLLRGLLRRGGASKSDSVSGE